MAKGTPKANKTAAPAKPASASKGTPKSKAAAAASPSTESASKKRVRLADDDSETAAAATAEDTPAKSAKKAKGGDGKSSKKAASQSTTTAEVEVGSNGVERKDLKDKRPSEVEQIKSADALKPAKGALKKSGNSAGDESSKAKTKGKGKGKKVEAEEEKEEEEEDDEVKLAEGGDADEEEDDDDEIDFLAGFESGEDDGEDSSDEEMDEDDDDEEEASKPKFDTRQLPKVQGETVQKKLAAKEKKQAKTGTIYLGRIPKGFYEDEMRSYFSQFGEVTRLRLSRNKKTGASKHYAFIEFKYASVAQIVQETMDNYLLLGHILVCKVVPDDQIHPKLWVGANRKFRVVPKSRKDAARRNKPKTDEQKEKIKKRLLSREDKKRKQLAELGIEYDFAGYRGAGKEEQVEAKVEEAAKPTPKKKGRKSAGGEEPAKKKARKST
ncbi:hypothetical protein C6P46_000152 [Rhodotorula mucilaginosa]|uniref:RRM domain-containing protein n=1 Tax=Rhodotorula mucilaginosa TaxID=5537 RepID=A0A9P7BAB0_RHOMI|nr:hypothetical protein C6P46_000152 [Rhodotorula mucilaginosa]